MQLEICTQLFRPVPVIIPLKTSPTAIIEDYIAAHFQDMFCNLPHDLFYALMSFIVKFLPFIMTKQLQVPNIKGQQERICLPCKLTGIGCFSAAR